MRNRYGIVALLTFFPLAIDCHAQTQVAKTSTPTAEPPFQRVSAVTRAYMSETAKMSEALKRATSIEERGEVILTGPDRRAYHKVMLKFETEFAGSKDAILALTTDLGILREYSRYNLSRLTLTEEEYTERRRDYVQIGEVLKRLEKYVSHPDIGAVCDKIWSDSPGLETVLRGIIETNGDPSCRGHALLALARKRASDASLIRLCRSDPVRKEHLEKRIGKDPASKLLVKDDRTLLREALVFCEQLKMMYGEINELNLHPDHSRSLGETADVVMKRINLLLTR